MASPAFAGVASLADFAGVVTIGVAPLAVAGVASPAVAGVVSQAVAWDPYDNGAGPMAPPIRARLRTGVFFQNEGIR